MIIELLDIFMCFVTIFKQLFVTASYAIKTELDVWLMIVC